MPRRRGATAQLASELPALHADQLERFDTERVAKTLDRSQGGVVSGTTADCLHRVVAEAGLLGQIPIGEALPGSPLMEGEAFT
jgi:hypothetical protein